ncbi:MAG TPA: type II CAAX endopeptidase family protein [Chthoniobacterales bacterium]|jgi:hypothetical protein
MLLKFFFITYLASWLLFAAAAYVLRGASSASGTGFIGSLLFLPGAIMPAIVALTLTARTEGRPGLLKLLQGITRWNVNLRWYVFALGYMIAIKVSVAILYRCFTGGWPQFGQIPWFYMAIAIVFSTPVQAGEEIGWRGYALPRLAERFGLGLASIILGILWACWHLPFFFISGSDNYGQSFSSYLIAVTALSVAMAWLYWRTNASLLLTMVMHAAVNNTAGIVRSPVSSSLAANPFAFNASLVAWLIVILLWLPAVYFLTRMHQRSASLTTA